MQQEDFRIRNNSESPNREDLPSQMRRQIDHKDILLKQKQMKDMTREIEANQQLIQEGNLGYNKETSNIYLQKKTINEDRNFKQSLKNNHS